MQDVDEMVPDPEWNRVPDSLDETAYMGQKFTVTQTFRRLPVPSPPKVEPHQSLSKGENESEKKKKRQRRKSGTKVDEGKKTSDRGKIDTGGNVDMRGKGDKLVKPAGSSQQPPGPPTAPRAMREARTFLGNSALRRDYPFTSPNLDRNRTGARSEVWNRSLHTAPKPISLAPRRGMDDGDNISPYSLKRAYNSLGLSRGHSSRSPSPLVKRPRLDKAQSVGEPIQSPNVQKKEEEVEVKEVEVKAEVES
jgi:hypothetical protein